MEYMLRTPPICAKEDLLPPDQAACPLKTESLRELLSFCPFRHPGKIKNSEGWPTGFKNGNYPHAKGRLADAQIAHQDGRHAIKLYVDEFDWL